MKKVIIWLLIFGTIGIFACGCAKKDDKKEIDLTRISDELENDEKILPVFDGLTKEEKELYTRLCYAMENFEDTNITVGKYESLGEVDKAKKEFDTFFMMLVFEQPQYFWINPYDYELITTGKTEEELTLSVRLNYLMEEDEAKEKSEELEKEVKKIVKKARSKDDLFEKVLYVYDYIMDNTKYDKKLADNDDTDDIARSAYGCLIEGKTVCTGYALAFSMIMHELDIHCGVEFSSYGELSLDNHVWNYCKLDGDYYYFDLTWDDTGFDSKDYKGVIDYSHLYFAITKKEFRDSRFTFSEEATTPDCNGTKYNYYVYKGISVEEYDLAKIEKMILAQIDNDYIELRFDRTEDRVRAEIDLIEEGKIHDILNTDASVSYVVPKTGHHLIFFKNNEQK